MLFLLVFEPISAFSQVHDSFSDGNFTANPKWLGDTNDFTLNSNFQLQLNNSLPDTSALYIPFSLTIRGSEWRFWTNLSFAPSDNNLSKIYLASDNLNLKGPLNGYFIRLGENGPDDSIDLWKQSGTTETKIINGINGLVSKSNNTLRVKVICDTAGIWSLFADSLGGHQYINEGSFLDTTHKTGNYFGIFCKYTISNATKFYYDDFYAGPIITDTAGPVIDSIDIITSSKISVYFNEPLNKQSAENTTNYTVNNGIGSASTVLLDSVNQHIVHLTFSTPFVSTIKYTLTSNNIKDATGNTSTSQSDTFLYYRARAYDIVINEIMADPDPPINLPNYEYLELYNTSGFPIKLNQWSITVGTNKKTIPSLALMPDSFVVLTSTGGAAAFTALSNVVAVSGFPALTNTGQTIIIKDDSSKIISAIAYTDRWYSDTNKEEGGYSLEQIDPLNPCAGASNWKATVNSNGGTPGKKNSVYNFNPDITPPLIQHTSVIDSTTVKLIFNEPLDSATLTNPLNYIIDNGLGSPISAYAISPFYSSVIISLSANLQKKTIYTLSLTTAIKDCKGNALPKTSTIKFAIPEIPVKNDIVFNEILYEPKDNGVEFVEIYNRSEKVVELKNIRISMYDTLSTQLYEVKNISSEGELLFPGEYKLLSVNATTVKSQYNTLASDKSFIELTSMPALINDGATIAISDTLNTIIDYVTYYPEMHYALLKETKGISLEKINFNSSSNQKTNWHSAATTVEATPGYINSQHHLYTGIAGIGISPEIFSPDNDGYNDVLTIHYLVSGAGYTGNITIFNSAGGLIKKLVKNELLSAEGDYTWDGTTENSEKAPLGIYIIYFEVFNLSGNIEKHKISCVLGGKL